ncbi:MAG: hypothetical protein JWO82_2068 [Akkermansiaceae bacterium]|nr:hypothetical protein [Akkermansiaceae bacterium]
MERHDEEPGACDAERLVLALKASNEGIWDWWVGKPGIYYSRRILEFLECGEDRAPNLFLEPYSSVHLEDRHRFAASVANATERSGADLLSIDCRVQAGSGHWRWIRIRGTVVRDREGEATRIAGSMIDISLRKEAEAQVDEERHLLRTLIDHVPLQVYFKDRTSRFVLANRQMANWMGLKEPGELLGKHDQDFFASEHLAQAQADEQRIMDCREPVNSKLERETWRGGEDTWVLTSKFPWVDRTGEVKGTFGVSSDVTELVKAQREATSLASELQQRNKVYEEELQLAREIQQALAGSQFPEVGRHGRGLRFAARYLPISGLAGDFFEILRITDQSAGLLIVDVMGHGIRSALVVAMLRGLLEKQRRSAADPSAFLRGLNTGLASILERANATLFATAFYAVADLATGTLRYACAGHPGAVAVSSQGTVRQLASQRGERGPGLGLIPKAEFPAGEIPLDQAKRLLLFTDGILEAENGDGEPFLENRLMEVVGQHAKGSLEDMMDALLDTVLGYSEHHHFDDDVCLLGMEVAGVPAELSVRPLIP